jgi:hypothetical protein
MLHMLALVCEGCKQQRCYYNDRVRVTGQAGLSSSGTWPALLECGMGLAVPVPFVLANLMVH